MGNYQNYKFKNVEAYWNSFCKKQSRKEVEIKGGPEVSNPVVSHIQGFGKVFDPINKSYISIASHNNKGESKGVMVYMDCGKEKCSIRQEVPIEHFNHPGGFQIVGDYLFVAVEDADYSKSYIRLCNLSNLYEGKAPEWIDESDFVITMPNHGAGMVGATRYIDAEGKEQMLITPCDNGKLYIYQVETDTDLLVKRGGTPKLIAKQEITNSVQSIGLVTQEDNTIYLVAFCSPSSGLSFKDIVELWKCTFENGVPKFTRVGEPLHVTTSGGGTTGVHFRYGAGLGIISNTRLEFFATNRNFSSETMKYDILYYDEQ